MANLNPVWIYTKSRDLFGGFSVACTVIKEKPDMNVEFYGEKVTAAQILIGKVVVQKGDTKWPPGAKKTS